MEMLISDPMVSGIFLFVGLVCMVLEVFIPSGGVLGLTALAAIVFGVYGLFHQGHSFLAAAVVLFYVAAFYLMFKFMMRRLTFKSSMTPETSNSVDASILELLGKEGVTVTALRPGGMALIDGRKVDVVTLGDYIERDTPVRVVDNSGNRVVVRQVESRSVKT